MIVGIPCDVKQIGLFPFHAVGDKYIKAVTGAVGATAILIPATGDDAQLDALLAMVDGILLPGSPSNIEPHHYQGEPSRPGTLHDAARDATTLPLVRKVIAAGVPLMGICRGFQEINVVLGGELHQHVQEQDGLADHREPETEDLSLMYGPAHEVKFAEGGWLHGWMAADSAMVNSIHQQGIKRLADDLVAEAWAPDGLIEAFRSKDSAGFVLAVQWHPEWQYWDNPLSQAIFRAFGTACREHRMRRNQ